MNKFYTTLSESEQLKKTGEILRIKPLKEQPPEGYRFTMIEVSDDNSAGAEFIMTKKACDYTRLLSLVHPSGDYQLYEPKIRGHYHRVYHIGTSARFEYQYAPVPCKSDKLVHVETSVKRLNEVTSKERDLLNIDYDISDYDGSIIQDGFPDWWNSQYAKPRKKGVGYPYDSNCWVEINKVSVK